MARWILVSARLRAGLIGCFWTIPATPLCVSRSLEVTSTSGLCGSTSNTARWENAAATQLSGFGSALITTSTSSFPERDPSRAAPILKGLRHSAHRWTAGGKEAAGLRWENVGERPPTLKAVESHPPQLRHANATCGPPPPSELSPPPQSAPAEQQNAYCRQGKDARLGNRFIGELDVIKVAGAQKA